MILKKRLLSVTATCAIVALSIFALNISASAEETDPSKSAASDSQYTNWKMISDSDGIKTFQRDLEEKYAVGFRGEMTIDEPIEKIAAILADMDSRKEWMDEVVETKRLHMKDLFDRVEYNHTAVPWPFQDRDFVYSAKVELDQKERTMIINLKSVEDPAMPVKDGIVRGEMKVSRYFIKELEHGKKSFISVEIVVDPKGAIPTWLVKLKQRKWPRNTFSGMRTYLKSGKIVVPEEFKVYSKPATK